jgi:hypothetical protein
MRKLEDLDIHPALKEQLQRRRDRVAQINEGRKVARVRVVPKNDAFRKALFHPRTRMRFPAQGSAEWPLDQFTKRRIRDGDVTIEAQREQRAEPVPVPSPPPPVPSPPRTE